MPRRHTPEGLVPQIGSRSRMGIRVAPRSEGLNRSGSRKTNHRASATWQPLHVLVELSELLSCTCVFGRLPVAFIGQRIGL